MDQIIEAIRELIKTAKTTAPVGSPLSKIKKVYYGDPILIPAQHLPAIVVIPQVEDVTARGTRYDQYDQTVTIKYIHNLKNDLMQGDDEYTEVVRTGVKLFSERDDDTGKFKPYTIAGILRANNRLPYNGKDTAEWNSNYNIRYEFTTTRDYIAYEANFTIAVKSLWDR